MRTTNEWRRLQDLVEERVQSIPKPSPIKQAASDKPLTPERAAEIIDEVFSHRRFTRAQWQANLNNKPTQQNNEQLERRS